MDAMDRKLDGLHHALGNWASRTDETDELLGRSLSDLGAAVDQLTIDTTDAAGRSQQAVEELAGLRTELSWLAADVHRSLKLVPAQVAALSTDPDTVGLEHVDETTARYLNRATGYRGLAAQAGIFVNEPVIIEYSPGSAFVSHINERIVEVPFVFRELHALPPASRIVDIGSSESTVALSLASLGYDVTAVDPRGYAFGHPNLSTFEQLADAPDHSFDAATVVSTIEHVGIAHYGQPAVEDADVALMELLATKVTPGGVLVLTTPYGDGRDAGFQRIYDHVRLRRILAAWTVEKVEIALKAGPCEWEVSAAAIDDLAEVTDDEYRVAMIVARAAP
jgi:2-polyprenyl-3-methyl-5-hydroxy-6-metoxy-1,4-benzoquinol methylase